MTTLAKRSGTPASTLFTRLRGMLRGRTMTRRRRQASIDLIHASQHLLRDIGASDHNLTQRQP